MEFYLVFNIISVIITAIAYLFMYFLDFTSVRLELWSVLPNDTPMNNQVLQWSSESGSDPDLQIHESNAEPRRTPIQIKENKKSWLFIAKFWPFTTVAGFSMTLCFFEFWGFWPPKFSIWIPKIYYFTFFSSYEGFDWMVFYAAFNSISVISRRQLTLFMLSWVSPVLGWALKCLAQGHSHEKTSYEGGHCDPLNKS